MCSRRILLLSAILSASIGQLFAETIYIYPEKNPETDGQWQERKDEGWFFYEDPLAITREEPKEERPSPPEKPKDEPHPEIEEAAVPKGPAPLSAAWYRENLQTYMDAAIDNPTSDNVRRYYYLQRVMMDKAQLFAEASKDAVMGDPFLDETTRRPQGTFAANTLAKISNERKETLMRLLSERVGLFFFIKGSECNLCEAQAKVMQIFQQKYPDFTVYPVSVDGKGLQMNPMPFRPDTGQAESLGIINTPALVLAAKDGQMRVLSQSAIAIDDIEQRIALAAKGLDVITPQEYDLIKAIDTNLMFIADENEPDLTEELIQDTDQFTEFVRDNMWKNL